MTVTFRYVYYLVEAAQRARNPRPFQLHDAPELTMPEVHHEVAGIAAAAAAAPPPAADGKSNNFLDWRT